MEGRGVVDEYRRNRRGTPEYGKEAYRHSMNERLVWPEVTEADRAGLRRYYEEERAKMPVRILKMER